MKRFRFCEAQTIGILKEYQSSFSAVELFRECGISDATFDK